jgi:hypothetical protein
MGVFDRQCVRTYDTQKRTDESTRLTVTHEQNRHDTLKPTSQELSA